MKTRMNWCFTATFEQGLTNYQVKYRRASSFVDAGLCIFWRPGDALDDVLVLAQFGLALAGGHHPHANRLQQALARAATTAANLPLC